MKLWQVAAVDNYDRETPSMPDMFVLARPMAQEECQAIASALNGLPVHYTEHFYRVVPEDYKLRTFEP